MGAIRIALTAETVGQKLNTKNLVQLKVAEQLSRNDSLFLRQDKPRERGPPCSSEKLSM